MIQQKKKTKPYKNIRESIDKVIDVAEATFISGKQPA